MRCEGLKGAAELNGCMGKVLEHVGARARVRIDGATKPARIVGVKSENLVLVAPPAPDDGANSARRCRSTSA